MLNRLSGQTHRVVTGYVVHGAFGHCCEAVTTLVSFRKLSQQEIQKYIATGEPFGKAGAYAIQGQARNFVDHIYGSLTNVIGLPLKEIQRALHLCTFLSKAEKGT
jgi:septum formation protein